MILEVIVYRKSKVTIQRLEVHENQWKPQAWKSHKSESYKACEYISVKHRSINGFKVFQASVIFMPFCDLTV